MFWSDPDFVLGSLGRFWLVDGFLTQDLVVNCGGARSTMPCPATVVEELWP